MAGRFKLLLVALVVALGAATAGCASQSTSAQQPTPNLRFVFDGNFITAQSAHDLHYTLVALNARDGHVAWRHQLEAPGSTDATGARYQPVYRDGLVYVGYYYDHATDPQNIVRHAVVEALDATTGKARWRRELGTELAGELVVDSSTVYVSASVEQAQGESPPTMSGLLAALDSRTGAVRWQKALEDAPSMAASADGRVFVVVSRRFAGRLLALDAGNGSVAWEYTADAPLTRGGDEQNGQSNAPLVVGGRVYAQAVERNGDGTANLKLLALDTSNGSVAWQSQTGSIAATPAFNQSGDTLCLSGYQPSGNTSAILGLDTSNGATRWRITGVQGGVSGCVASGDIFYLTLHADDEGAGSVLALNSKDGRQLWKTPVGSPVAADGWIAPTAGNGVVGAYLQASTPTADNGVVGPYLLASTPPPGPLNSTIVALRASDGKPLWRHDFAGRPERTLDIEGDLIFNAESLDNLPVITTYARDTGALLWSYGLGHL